MDSMKFSVGPFVYTFVVSSRDLWDESGEFCEAYFYEDRRLIVMSPRVEPQRRAEVLKHEIKHCWETHVGQPNSEEGRCQLFATISESFDADLERQGGREALERMTPRTVNHLGKPAPAPASAKQSEAEYGSPSKTVCGECQAETMCGSIEEGDVEAHAAGGFRKLRWFRCDQCGALQVWFQYCLATGELLPGIVPSPKPRILRGVEAGRFIDERQALRV